MKDLTGQWQRLCALAMWRLGASELEITAADAEAFAIEHSAVVAKASGDSITLALVDAEEAERLAREDAAAKGPARD